MRGIRAFQKLILKNHKEQNKISFEKRQVKFMPKLYSIIYNNCYVYSSTLGNNVFYRGRKVGRVGVYNNLILDWQKIKKTQLF